jgi:hypothetical protein
MGHGQDLLEGRNSLTSGPMTGDPASLLWWILLGGTAALLAVGAWVWSKGRPFAAGDVFRASRLSGGNRLFPTQVLITPTNVVQFTPQWIGKQEESIHIAHISSVRIDTGLMFSDLLIETTGGASPIRCHGHRKGDAVSMKALVERYQTAYYTAPPPAPAPAGPVGPGPTRR